MKIYKVRHTPSGLYWKGGGIPSCKRFLFTGANQEEIDKEALKLRFSKLGKNWNQLNHVNSALSGSKTDRLIRNVLNDCIVEVYELIKIN